MMLLIGYPVFWLEMSAFHHPDGHASPLAWILFSVLTIYTFAARSKSIANFVTEMKNWFGRCDWFTRIWFLWGTIFVSLILAIIAYAYFLPPHLIQEFDVLNYHLTLPKQHLMLNSFHPIPWATADFYLLTVDFALAPYWLATSLPNKYPQFILLIGLICVAANCVDRFGKRNWTNIWMILLAIFASHHIEIQMGTAMLDLAICYLFLAAIDSFLNGNIFLAAVEFTFYFWSKSFIPVQTVLVIAVMLSIFFVLRKLGFCTMSWTLDNAMRDEEVVAYQGQFKKMSVYFVVLSLWVAGPFVLKSVCYTGSPLFPFNVGSITLNQQIDKNSLAWQSLVENAQLCLDTKDQYGSGRSVIEFIRHLWLIAVPEEGVNNRYDYPAGLMYLLVIGPFFYLGWRMLAQRTISILILWVEICWLVWWIGSHQTRFLLIPLVLMLVVVTAYWTLPSKIFMSGIILALGLEVLSVYGAHHRDLGRLPYDVLRERDRTLLKMAQEHPSSPVQLNFPDAAFADFPVDVRDVKSVFVLRQD